MAGTMAVEQPSSLSPQSNWLGEGESGRSFAVEHALLPLMAAYVIPENAWYLIPAVRLLGERRKSMAMLCPITTPEKKASYCYEGYREAWKLLKKNRAELLECGPARPPL